MTLRLSGGRRLQSPPGATARPTAARVRQAVFNLLAAELPGCRWLDLCCGSGVMACEALQRGAGDVVAIERDRRVAAVACANLEAVVAGLGTPPPRFRVIQADARRWLASRAPIGGIGGCQERGASSEYGGGGTIAASPSRVSQKRVDSLSEDLSSGETSRTVREDLNPSTVPVRKAADHGLRADGPDREQPFDLIYCDPPWPAGLHRPLTEAVARGGWIRSGGILVWECPSGDVPTAPAGWALCDQRRYGGSTVVLLEPL